MKHCFAFLRSNVCVISIKRLRFIDQTFPFLRRNALAFWHFADSKFLKKSI